MHIEIRDPSIVERLRRLLPRPDAPFDEVIAALLEQPCRLRVREIVDEVLSASVEKLAEAVRQAVASSLGDLERKISSSVERAVREAVRHMSVVEGGGGWEAVIREASRRADGCLTFAEVRRYYGRNLNSVMLRKRGFVQRERGLWCWPRG